MDSLLLTEPGRGLVEARVSWPGQTVAKKKEVNANVGERESEREEDKHVIWRWSRKRQGERYRLIGYPNQPCSTTTIYFPMSFCCTFSNHFLVSNTALSISLCSRVMVPRAFIEFSLSPVVSFSFFSRKQIVDYLLISDQEKIKKIIYWYAPFGLAMMIQILLLSLFKKNIHFRTRVDRASVATSLTWMTWISSVAFFFFRKKYYVRNLIAVVIVHQLQYWHQRFSLTDSTSKWLRSSSGDP